MALIPSEAIRAIGRAFAEGTKKYGRDNWLKGMPQTNLIQHAQEHIMSFLDGDESEEHLGHALWNLAVAAHQKKFRPDLDDRPPYAQYDTRPKS